MKEFDYYIFIDYSGSFLGYLIVDNNKIPELMPRISKFAHYRDLRHKSAYLRSIKKIIKKGKILSYFVKYKFRELRQNIDIYSDVFEFLKKHEKCIIFISIDNHQYLKFRKMVKIIERGKTVIKKESELRKGTPEYQISLVLDTLLNIRRLNRKRKNE